MDESIDKDDFGPSSAKLPCLAIPTLQEGTKDVVPQDLLQIYEDIQSDSDSEHVTLSESESETESEDNGSSCENDLDLEGSDVQVSSDKWQDALEDESEIIFKKFPGLMINIPTHCEPIEYFELFANDNFYNIIIEQTNSYGRSLDKIKESSRKYPEWKELTKSETKIFIGLLLHMGHIQIPHLTDYWNKDPLLNMSCFNTQMTRFRFFMILKYLQFSPYPDNDPHTAINNPQINKILPLIQHFNTTLCKIYSPGKNLTLDVPITLHKGRVVFSHDPKGKGGKHGIKMYTLSDNEGVSFRCCVYIEEDCKVKNSVTDIVLDLLGERLNEGHTLYLAEFYASHQLAVLLRQAGTYCTAPLRIDRTPSGYPVPSLKQGELVCKYSEGVAVCKWKDRRHVLYVTSEPGEKLVEFRSKGKLKKRPRGLVEHEKRLNPKKPVDVFSYYPLERTPLRWYKKIGVHVIQLMVLNAYVLYSLNCRRRCSLLEFRLSVVRRLLSLDKALVARYLPAVDMAHLPAKHAFNDKGKALRKRCKLCYSLGKRRDTTYCCPICPDTPALCLQPCFARFHHSDLLNIADR